LIRLGQVIFKYLLEYLGPIIQYIIPACSLSPPAMENPHNERQAILLQRIVKSVVCPPSLVPYTPIKIRRELLRLNATTSFKSSTDASRSVGIFPPDLHSHPKRKMPHLVHVFQQIVQANEEIRLGADLASKYRKNAQFNIEALRAGGALPSDPTPDINGDSVLQGDQP
jgi:hypothetical protein